MGRRLRWARAGHVCRRRRSDRPQDLRSDTRCGLPHEDPRAPDDADERRPEDAGRVPREAPEQLGHPLWRCARRRGRLPRRHGDDRARGAGLQGLAGRSRADAGFSWGDLSWQCNASQPVGINPKGCLKSGRSIDGVLPDDQRRGGTFRWPPPKENYAYEALQGALMQAVILQRYGTTPSTGRIARWYGRSRGFTRRPGTRLTATTPGSRTSSTGPTRPRIPRRCPHGPARRWALPTGRTAIAPVTDRRAHRPPCAGQNGPGSPRSRRARSGILRDSNPTSTR